MKKVARELREINNTSDIDHLLSSPNTFVDPDKEGVYVHNGVYYLYIASRWNIDYFEKIVTPLKIGIPLTK